MTAFAPKNVSVQRQSNSRGWLRTIPRKRHQMRHLCDLARLVAKQVLSQLSYTPTVGVTLILKHFRARRNPFLRFSVITVPKLYQNPGKRGLFAPQQHSFRWLGG